MFNIWNVVVYENKFKVESIDSIRNHIPTLVPNLGLLISQGTKEFINLSTLCELSTHILLNINAIIYANTPQLWDTCGYISKYFSSHTTHMIALLMFGKWLAWCCPIW